MSRVAQQPKPTTESGLSKDLKIAQLVKTYPESLFRGLFEEISSKTVKYSPQDIGRGKSCSRFLFEMSDESRHIRITDQWEIDLATTGITLSSQTGGIVDDIARANGEKYLVWAFLDQYMQFAGLGATRKPRSDFSAIAGGSANKGNTNKDFTVTNAYQFVPGARVCVRNDNGTAPAYQWNWATVDSVQNSTTVRLDMDNQAYGTNITGTTNGEIIQWNMFRPYVVASTSQTLYQPYYSLIGELYTDSSTGNIERAYRADEPIRELEWEVAYLSGSTVSGVSLYLGRWLPLWATHLNCYLIGDGAANERIFLGNSMITATAIARIFTVSAVTEQNSGFITLDQYAKLLVTSSCSTDGTVRLLEYYIPTGMRG